MARKSSHGVLNLTDKSSIDADLTIASDWIKVLQTEISILHDTIWFNGTYNANNTDNSTDVKRLMTGGFYLTASEVLVAVDLRAVNRSSTLAEPTNKVTEWFEDLLVPKLINTWYKSNDVFIVYIPYGQVLGLNSDHSWETFTIENCTSQWMGNTKWNDSVVATCQPTGMAVLTNGAQTMFEPSFYEIGGMIYNGNTYSAQDMITSSLTGFLQHGFK